MAFRLNRAGRRGRRAARRIAAALAVGLALLPAAVGARELVVQSVFPAGMVFLSDSERHVAERTAAVSGGALTLNFVGSGAIVRAPELFAAVQDGRVEAAWDWIGYRAAQIPVAGVIASYPYGPSPVQLAAWLYGGGGEEILRRAYAREGLFALPCHMVVSEAGGWFLREIETVEDFKGLRMRIAGLGAQVLERLGGVPSNEPVDALYDSLAAGRLDAIEFSVPMADLSLGFDRFARYYYFPGWHQPSSVNVLMMRLDTWDSLAAQEREILTSVCRANIIWSLANGLQPQAAALDTFRAQGIEVRRFSYPVLKRLQAVSREVLADAAAKDPLVAEAVRSMTGFMTTLQRWESLQQLPP
ncbi:TRAP transporter substrate-binding protein [Caenispirillum bisanense]|uniref:TRAP-type mannitol/chloroaromatic compound transport system, substrate-binding protein n=1 Tax=Caenispirillum bisanense TaxID=414052 RepID=A0A286GA23_9PROT|nr:TRAP transporter substrate-binding protein [Caenispirillum bisanense]SOD91834.1 TRAP-type mannitol/chloroaromatic compound transport system, substrate-binding protein [Caenispirillum bisanense]